MIGRRCKAGDSLSRAALIARALTRRIPAGAAACAWRVQLRSKRDIRSVKLAVRPPGHAEGSPEAWEARERLKTSAAHRSAAMAGGARPDPFRTRKLSRRAPMVLRGKPVGEQGAADRWTALDPFSRARARGRRGGIPPAAPPFFHSCVPHLNFLVFLGQREMRGFSYVRRPRGHAPHRPRRPAMAQPGARPHSPSPAYPPPWPSRGRDAKPLSRQALLIGELGAARRSAGCRGGTAANGRCLRAGGPSPAVRDTCPIAPRRSPRRCPARLFCRRICVFDSLEVAGLSVGKFRA